MASDLRNRSSFAECFDCTFHHRPSDYYFLNWFNNAHGSHSRARVPLVPLRKQYVLKDVMKRRKKDLDAVENKLKAKQLLKSSRPKKETIKLPDKFVKKYRAAQRSFADLKRRVNAVLISDHQSPAT